MKHLQLKSTIIAMFVLFFFVFCHGANAQIKIGYIDSQKILANFKDALDVQKQLDAKSQEWTRQLQDMQAQANSMQEQLESQSLLLSQEKKDEKLRDIQELALKFQKFREEKWGQNGAAFKLQQDLMQPVFDKIQAEIDKIGKTDKYDFVFDGVAGNIVYASPDQDDLTDRILEELNKGVAVAADEKK